MAWFKVDDGFWSNPKVIGMSEAATSLWVRAGSYSCQHLTDGFIPNGLLRLLGTGEAADELVDVGLWYRADGGFTFHDWDEYQETSDTVKARRDAARERQRSRRAQRDKPRPPLSQDSQESQCDTSVTHSEVTLTSQECSQEVPTPDPTRPDPTLLTTDVVKREGRASATTTRTKGTRIDANWMPDQTVIEAMKTERPYVDLEGEHRKFVDHFLSAPGQRGVKVDWNATWRNWIRRAGDNAPAPSKMSNARQPGNGYDASDWLDSSSVNAIDADVIDIQQRGIA